ncbi:hypothetical protein M413DRAFT_217952 [Hebeloma cylindrosporum]|uniref:Uncharacterized protein n=1 Tax=Hebeloma cylindrosporum TaxID=76867 RepID=A0A0C3CV37_HEBCY|nr:hypothetical protein M413DRAFT_217952 [Hebeloma cylindrosporum h7]
MTMRISITERVQEEHGSNVTVSSLVPLERRIMELFKIDEEHLNIVKNTSPKNLTSASTECEKRRCHDTWGSPLGRKGNRGTVLTRTAAECVTVVSSHYLGKEHPTK